MCGIIGYIGPRPAAPIILNGLRRLEYRGYDSAGIAILTQGRIHIRRAVGKLANLEAQIQDAAADSLSAVQTGIGHTRWATHGAPSEHNAHPHVSMDGAVAVVHNGIVENFAQLRRELQAEGVVFRSETDSEVIAHLVERHLRAGHTLEQAAHAAIRRLHGSQAIVLMSAHEPGVLVAARIGNAGGVSIGLGDAGAGEMFIASDIPGILEYTRRIIFLDSHEVAVVQAGNVRVRRLDGDEIVKTPHLIAWDPVSAEKGEYRHFMQKEIHEQARAITDTLRGRVDFETGAVTLEDLAVSPQDADRLHRLYTVACGTSAHAGLIGKFLIERIANLSVEVDYGSEFRYRNPLIDHRCAALGITQSGETADTLAAMQEAKRKGATVWSIVNAVGSQAQRSSDGYILMRAGPEIGVASTKAFTASLVDQYLLACYLSQQRRTESDSNRDSADAKDLAFLPNLVSRTLEPNPLYDELAHLFHDREHFLYLGRGINYPVALEGALKLKEISYIHAEGYPAGEMKHGPIALIDEQMPVVCIAVQDAVYDKMISQIEQVKARKGIVIAVATEGDPLISQKADYVLWVPDAPPLLTPVLTVIPLQRLAYHLAVRRGCDVDQPRNLAKSVTVE
ncbi:MAG: glutamine--fructose-6-phosphate transaminase (isomerizing) [Anaerolineae bacterium]|nr:glutamine--fructose-6-phosphate transaminase (isomerizing) [Thermoflexales bacterium]MDW8407409.1 glutamine--fructose-6-phosphate transaminase (isomerizing) [Anaerolineae bacterium]